MIEIAPEICQLQTKQTLSIYTKQQKTLLETPGIQDLHSVQDQPRDQRESRKNLDLDNFWPVSTNLSLDNPENCGLDQISISTIHKLWVSHKSRSRQFWKFESHASLDLDNFENLNLVQISISTIFRFFISKSRFFKNTSDSVKAGLPSKI